MMIKSGDQIEYDFYILIEDSPLKSFVRGSMYRDEARPHDATTEDLEVTFKVADGAQFQSGEVSINVYVPHIDSDNRKIRDYTRCRMIGNKLLEVAQELTDSEYLIEVLTTPKSIPIDGSDQTMVNMRLEFTRVEN